MGIMDDGVRFVGAFDTLYPGSISIVQISYTPKHDPTWITLPACHLTALHVFH
jgi:hypothetical protein